MKYFNKLILFLLVLAGFSKDIAAYKFTVTNLTGVPVKVQLYFTPFPSKSDQIEPYDTKIFSLGSTESIACLTKIMVSSFDEEKNRWLGEIKASIKEIDADQFNKTKAAIAEFTGALKLGLPTGSSAVMNKLAIADKAIESLGRAAVGATALYGASLCRNRDFLIILDQLVLPNGRPITIKKVIENQLVEEPLLIPYALSTP